MSDRYNWMLVPGTPVSGALQLEPSTSPSFDLLNEYVLQRFVYKRREYGINLDWADLDPSQPALYVRSRSGSSVVNYGELVALGVGGGSYLRYGEQEYGINLRWSGSPVYEWSFATDDASLAGTPVQYGPLTSLHNKVTGDVLFYDPRQYGINFKWLRDKGEHNGRSWSESLGNVLRGIVTVAGCAITELFHRALSVGEFLLSMLGIYLPRYLTLKIVILRDEHGTPVMMDETDGHDPARRAEDEQQFWKAVGAMRRCLNQMNVKVQLAGPAKEPWTIPPFPAPTEALDVRCNDGALGDDWGAAGRYFRRYTSGAFLRPYLTMFVVRRIDGKEGCSLGPFSSYVTVSALRPGPQVNGDPTWKGGFSDYPAGETPAADEQRPTTPIHEIGHACALKHEKVDGATPKLRSYERTNLMKAATPRGVRLNRLQKAIFRSSRFLSYDIGTTGTITSEPNVE